MAAKRPTKYMDYLHNPLSPVPKSTKYSRKQKHDRLKDKQSPEPCRNNETESTEDLGTTIDNQNDQKTVYDMLFDLQQQIGDDGDFVNNEINEIDIDDDDFNIDIDEDESDEVFLDDPINLPEFNPFQLLYTGAKVTYHDLAVLLITLKTAFNTSDILLLFVMKLIKMVVPENGLSFGSLKQLYGYFDNNDINIRRHYFCSVCQYYTGLFKPNSTSCTVCGKTDFEYFAEIPMEKELQKIVERNWDHLDYRFKKKTDKNCINDVYDGLLYKRFFNDNGFLKDRNNVSLIGNTDGVAIFKSSAFSVWPVYMVINELPPNLRFRRENRLLCGIWFGKAKPNFTTFFKPFTELLWTMYREGFQVTDKHGTSHTCKALLLQMTCDTPAKCMFQDFIQFNGYYGCPYCLHSGFYNKTEHCQTYPYISTSDSGCGDLRTHDGTVEHARIARENLQERKKKYAEKGVKGLSWAFSLPEFDIINGMCLDYMHAVLLGVMKQLLKFWFGKEKKEKCSIYSKTKLVEEKLKRIKPPNNITRVPRGLDDIKHWKASEYRSFLLFYGPVCLHGVLESIYYDHFMLLSAAVWLLLQTEISPTDLANANCHLLYFCYQMSALYGDRAMSFSIHLLLHLTNTVKQNGPLWCQSCFWFEDYNGELRQFFHSSQHPDSQVVRAVSIVQLLPKMVQNMDINSEAFKLQKKMTSDRYKTKLVMEIEKGIYMVGKSEPVSNGALLATIEVQCQLPFYNATPTKYRRLLLYGQMIHSRQYQKVSQRNSYTVEYLNKETSKKEYGQIEYFIDVNANPDDHQEFNYYAYINKFTVKRMQWTADSTTKLSISHLNALERQREMDMVLVPVQKLLRKVIFMDTENLLVVGLFPNDIEKD